MQPPINIKPAVLIIGAGPVGLTMAIELARYNIPLRIIDKAPQRTDKSKALVLWSRTLELLDRAGCGNNFVDAGQKVFAANIIAGTHRVAHVSLDDMETPHPYALMIPQSETERLLEEHLNTLGVRVERQVELTHFADAGQLVTAKLTHANGVQEDISIPWMIGCDGAHSTVRHGLGVQFEGSTLPSDWVLADVHATGGDLKPTEFNMYWHSDGALAIFPISPGRYRLIADVGNAQSNVVRPDPTLAEIQAILDQRGPGDIQLYTPIWLAAFRINERKVADYRVGRIFLAGDAAHIHSPAGGQGMNTGMQDAFNLGWKLAMVHRGVANSELLLSSYSTERSTVGDQVLKDADRLTTIAILRSGTAQAIRNHIASLVFGLATARHTMANKLAELSIGYPKSPLTLPGKHLQPIAGQRAPITANSSPLFSLCAIADADTADFIDRYPDLLDPQLGPPFLPEGIWLVRPDGYVATVAPAGNWAAIENHLKQIAVIRPRAVT